MKGAAKTKARLRIGSKVVYKSKDAYKGFENSPTHQQRLTVEGIYTTHIRLVETPNIHYDISTFFDFFTEIRWDDEDEQGDQ